jgi:putative tricarboxylic transport membrane protein
MLLSQGQLSIFWSNPLVGSLTALALIMLLWPVLQRFTSRQPGTAQGV